MDIRLTNQRISSLVMGALVIVLCVSLLSPLPVVRAETDDPQPNNPRLFGIASHAWWLDPKVNGEELFAAIDDLDVTTVRVGIDWKRFERERGTYDWSKYDRVFGALADRNIEIIANFNTIPAWASADFEGCSVPELEPATCELRDDMYGAFEDAMHAAVSRYSWIEHWEYWNEPEMWTHFRELTYLEHLRIFYDVVQEINPEIQVAASTLVGAEYMEWLYNVSEDWYGEGNYPWDAIAYHPYNEHGAGFADPDIDAIRYERVEELHKLMIERSGPDMKMWITEYGWYGDPQDQARNLVEVLDWMRQQPYIEFAHLHMLHDWHETDESEHYGLMSIVPNEAGETVMEPGTQFEPKPYFYDAFKDYPRTGTRPHVDQPGERYFPETGHVTSGRFLDYWLQNGDYRTIGLPITRPYPMRQSDGSWLLVQDFERVRMEFHPDLQGTQYEVLGTLIGRSITEDREDEPAFRPLDVCEPDDSRNCFSETGHSLAYGFRDYWYQYGGLTRFGFPISEEFTELNPDTGEFHTVQYFERARFEYHPDLAGTPFEVQLGLLIRDDVQNRGWIPPESPRNPTWRMYE
jgi:hypothetical protein